MSALIQGALHIDPEKLSEDEWYAAWGRAKYVCEIMYGVKFS